MREARGMTFQQVVAASLPSVTNPPRIWAKDGIRWYSSFISASRDRSFSFESRVAGGSLGLSLSQGHREVRTRISSPELRSFDAFLEEEGIVNPSSSSPDERDEDVVEIPVVSGSKAQPIVLDMDDVAICENDHMPEIDIKYLDRYSSDESDERATNPERVEDVWDNPNPTSSSKSLGNHDEDLDEVVFSDLHSVKPTDRSPSKLFHVASDVSSPSPSVQTIPLVPATVQTIPLVPVTVPTVELATSSENSDVDDFALYLEQSIDVPVTAPTVEPATSSENPDGDGFADYLERSIAENGCAKPSIAEKHGAKRSFAENHGAKRSTENHGVKRRRLNPQRIGGPQLKFSFPDLWSKRRLKTKLSPRAVLPRTEQRRLNKTVKEQATVYPSENLETVRATLASFPVKGGKNHARITTTGLEVYADELEVLLIDESPVVSVRDILAQSKEASKTGLPPQVTIQLAIVCPFEVGPHFGANSLCYVWFATICKFGNGWLR